MQDCQDNGDEKQLTLNILFQEGQSLMEKIASMSSSDRNYSNLVRESISKFRICETIVESNNIFSSNEDLNDICSSSLKYLSIPYFLGELHQNIGAKIQSERLFFLEKTKTFLVTFLDSMSELKLFRKEDIKFYLDPGSFDAGAARKIKISRFNYEKNLKQKLSCLLREQIQHGISGEEGEESDFERDISLLMLRIHCVKALNSINTVKEEILIVTHMVELMKDNEGQLPKIPLIQNSVQMEPIVIGNSKLDIKNAAFTPAWNLHSVSIEEANFIDYHDALQREKQQKYSDEQKKLVKEFDDSSDDAEEVRKKREWDEWKDDNPVGSGNTGTKGYMY
jgi:hypothetical protein